MSAVTVVIPAHNAGRFLEETIASVRAQTRPPERIILVDDGSTDDTVTISRRLGLDVLRLAEQGGAARARNAGVQATNTDLIAFQDADDLWLPDHLRNLETLLERYPEAVLAYSRVELFGDMTWTQEAWLPAGRPVDARWTCTRRTVVFPPGSMVRRTDFVAVGGFDPSLRASEDFEFFRRLALRGPFVMAEPITVRYRKYPEQTSRKLALCRTIEYQVRRRWQAEASEAYSRVIVLNREAWAERLAEAWEARSWPALLMYLRLGLTLPGMWSVLLRRLPKLALFPVLPLLDRIRLRGGGVPSAWKTRH